MNAPLVTIIMPARNVAKYIRDAVQSVLDQEYSNWELLIVENASTDNTKEIINEFKDQRIKCLSTSIAGLSNARNIGLQMSQGELICFLDADDRLPTLSVSKRVEQFVCNPSLTFADGIVRTFNYDLSSQIAEWKPDFIGIPKDEMALLSPRCFSGITWMIRKTAIGDKKFDNTWTHLEDRLFFLQIASAGAYSYVEENTYDIRRRPGSLMTNHIALEKAYQRFLEHVKHLNIYDDAMQKKELLKFHRMFFRTYVKYLQPARAAYHWALMNIKRFT